MASCKTHGTPIGEGVDNDVFVRPEIVCEKEVNDNNKPHCKARVTTGTWIFI